MYIVRYNALMFFIVLVMYMYMYIVLTIVRIQYKNCTLQYCNNVNYVPKGRWFSKQIVSITFKDYIRQCNNFQDRILILNLKRPLVYIRQLLHRELLHRDSYQKLNCVKKIIAKERSIII